MLPSAEVIDRTERFTVCSEQYGLSLSSMREVGRTAIAGANDLEELESTKQLRGEFDSCVFEGLSSDKEHGEGLRVTKFKEYPIKNNQVMSEDGKIPIVELIKNGQESSRAAAETDDKMWTQYHRDINDGNNAQEVDAMVANERDYNTRLVISCEPAEAIERDGIKYWNKKGYIEDTAYVQLYHFSKKGTLLTGSLSFRAKDKDALRAKLSEFGIKIPANESADNYINYASTATLDEAGAKKLGLDVRDNCEEKSDQNNIDTVDILSANGGVNDAAFREMYLPIVVSLAQKQKTEKTAQIVATFLARSKTFSPEVRSQLIKTHNLDYFDDDSARLMHKLIVYSTIEKLRTALSQKSSKGEPLFTTGPDIGYYHQRPDEFIQHMVSHALVGVEAGREYTSCGAGINLSAKEELENITSGLLQEAFQGKSCAKEVKNGDRVNCPHCHKKVTAIVENKKKIECSNGDCVKAAAKVIKLKRSKP